MKEARHQRPCILGLWLWDRPIRGKSKQVKKHIIGCQPTAEAGMAEDGGRQWGMGVEFAAEEMKMF